jgi:hypothetical protein
MTEDQIRTIQSFIKGTRAAIKAHEEYRDASSLRVLMYSAGRLEGAYCMLGNRCSEAHVHATVQEVFKEYEAASALTLK